MVDSHGKTSFKGYSEAQVGSLLGAKNLASMRGKDKLNMLHTRPVSDLATSITKEVALRGPTRRVPLNH